MHGGQIPKKEKVGEREEIGIPEEGTPQLLPKQNANFTETHNLLPLFLGLFFYFFHSKPVNNNENL